MVHHMVYLIVRETAVPIGAHVVAQGKACARLLWQKKVKTVINRVIVNPIAFRVPQDAIILIVLVSLPLGIYDVLHAEVMLGAAEDPVCQRGTGTVLCLRQHVAYGKEPLRAQ